MNHLLRPYRSIRIFATLAAFALCAALAVPAAFAQITSGNMVGVVKDASGAIIPDASIVIVDEATGVVTNTKANSSGEYLIGNLPIGLYDVEVKAAGFQAYKLKGVAIDLNKTSTANIVLGVGTAQSVEVTVDSGVVIDTTSNNLTTNFAPEELAFLPSTASGAGVINAALLSPGVVSSGGLGIGVGGSIGGQRPRNNNFTIEGIDNNSKVVTGPLVYVPNDAVGSFTVVTNQFSPEFGHSSGGQFNTTVISGTNKFHGVGYEYFDNRNLNAANGVAGGKIPNPRYDYNRYGGEIGGPIFKNKLFFFGNYERQTVGQNLSNYLCTPTAAGLATLNGLSGTYGFSANNLAQFIKAVPAATVTGPGGTGVDAATDVICGNQTTGPQYMTVSNSNYTVTPSGTFTPGVGYATTNIPLGNYLVSAPTFSNRYYITTSADYTVSSKDALRVRYIYNNIAQQDTNAQLPAFFGTNPYVYYLATISEYHTFTPNLTSEFRLGFNRYSNNENAAGTFPGLDSYPNLVFNDQAAIQVGPDPNAPQFTIQNTYQLTENITYTKGKHSIKFGFDGRKYISPQQFTQRARGDYEYSITNYYLHDLAPDSLGQRSSGTHTYYGDQTALYGYANDTYRVSPTVTINAGLRYEFTSVPTGERTQALNAQSSVAGLVSFHAPQPGYLNFAPRFGINWAPDSKTSVRAGFGISYDVIFDNLGTLSFPPELSITQNVGTSPAPGVLSSGFLANGGLPASFSGNLTVAAAKAGTSALIPDQVVPYAETYSLTIQRTLASNYTLEIGYLGTRGIHLETQDQLNVTPRVTTANQLSTSAGGTTLVPAASATTNYAAIAALSNILPQWSAAGFTSKITSYQPFSESNYNGLITNITRRFQHGLQATASYTWSKTMDDATDEVNATYLTPRRQQNSQCIACDYSLSALSRKHRLIVEAVYDFPYFKHSSNFFLKNGVGNWTISPVYTYESPEYATALSGVNSNYNGDTASAIDRPIINPLGSKSLGTGVTKVYSPALAGNCVAPATTCNGNLVGYSAINPNAYYVQAGVGTLPNVSRNTIPIRPIDNFDLSAYKRITVFERYSVEVGAQGFNVLNHAQYVAGSVNGVNSVGFLTNPNFQTVTNAFFSHPEKEFGNNGRTLQLSGKLIF